MLPKFLAAGIPCLFQNYKDAESRYLTPPHLPTDFKSLNEFERAQAQEEYRRRHAHFFYLGFTQKRFNKRHWVALEDNVDIPRRRLFDHAGEPWEGLNTPLQYDLVRVWQAWNEVTSSNHGEAASACPGFFT